MKIALFGGTFNPIHNGHIYLVMSAIQQLNFDKVLIIPNNIPPHKPIPNEVSNKNRFDMCCLATKGYDKIEVSDIELKKASISYTIDTITEMKKQYKNDEIYLLLGSDMFLSFLSWKRPHDIFKIAKICVLPRDDNIDKVSSKCDYFCKLGATIEVLNAKPFKVSSTEIREKVFLGEQVSNLLSDEVERYIKDNNLYK